LSIFINMEFNDDILKIFSSLDAKILFQNPGKSPLLKIIINEIDKQLVPYFKVNVKRKKFAHFAVSTKRAKYIRQNMIYIVDENRLHTIWIRGALDDELRTYSTQYLNLAYENPLTFNYWNMPPQSFDIIVAENPVRLEMLKESGIIIK